MIEGLKPYAEYKDSGLTWLGRVPRHWAVRRAKSSIANVVDQTTRMEANDVYVALENIESWTGRVRPQSGSSLFTGQVKRFRANDVLFGKLRPYLAKVTRWETQGVCVGELFVLRPRDGSIIPEFLELLLRAKTTIDVINSSTFGAKMPRADWQFVGNLHINFPPPDEQAAIVRFLDHANRKIDGFIRAKRKLIGLLNEQKQAIIHRAVTGKDEVRRVKDENGNSTFILQPSSLQTKPSGIPWLDGVPSHWPMHSNRSLFQIRKRIVGARHREFQVLSLTKRGVIVRDMDAGGKFSSFWGRSQEVRPGNMVFCLFDVDETPRAVGLSHVAGMISPDYTVMECPAAPIASFLELFYMSMDDHKMLKPLYTGLRKRISKPLFLAAKTPIPLDGELRAIVEYVMSGTKTLTTAIARTEREISLMQEYRTRLTADVVTGKLDVREAAAKLPDLVEAPAHPVGSEADDPLESEDME